MFVFDHSTRRFKTTRGHVADPLLCVPDRTFISQRWIFAILACAGLCLQTIFAVIMSITIIEMVVYTEIPEEQDVESCPSTNNFTFTNNTLLNSQIESNASNARYPWDEYTQGIILSSFSWSSMVALFVYGALAERFGGKQFIGFGILTQAILTFAIPSVISWGGATGLIIIRVLIGLGTDGMYPVVSTMIPNWSTPSERTSIGNTVYVGTVVGLFFGNIMPALIMKYSGMGWPAVFYFFGIVGIIWFILWVVLVHENPEVHPFISDQEMEHLQSILTKGKKKNRKETPWEHILSSKEFWAFTISCLGCNCSYYIMLTGLPRYMGNVVKFPIETNGYFSALPYIFMWFNSMICAWISDKLLEKEWMSLTNVRKLLTTVSIMGAAFFLLLASYAECDKTLVVIFFIMGITMIGGVYPSMLMNPMDLSPNYAGSITSAGTGSASSFAILAPYLIGVLAPNSTLGEWRIVFWVVISLASFSSIVYLIWFEAKVQPWDDPEFLKLKTRRPDMKEAELKLMS